MWSLLISLAMAGSVVLTVDVHEDGMDVVDAILVDAEPRDLPRLQPDQHAIPGTVTLLDREGHSLGGMVLPDPRQRSVIYPEGGGDAVTLAHARTRVWLPWPEGAVEIDDGWARMAPRRAQGDAIPVSADGDPADRLDLVFLGDGYTQSQLDTFANDVDDVVDYLEGISPYGEYKGLFNIWRVDRASDDSGIDNGASGGTKATAYGCYYECGGIERLICCNDSAVLNEVNQAVPAADGILVLINDPKYGGSGGFNYATSYTGPGDGVQVAAHELGHSLVGLWDEYDYGYTGSSSGPNCASSSEGDWDEWLDHSDVGAYATCSYPNLYRPTDEACMMNTLQDDYCPVCRQEATLAIYSKLPGLIGSVTAPEPEPVDEPADTDSPADEVPEGTLTGFEDGPDMPFLVDVIADPSRLTFEWRVDGEPFRDDADFDLRCSGANGELTLAVYDDTHFVRADPNSLLYEEYGPWQVLSDDCGGSLEEILEACGCATGPSGGWLALPLVLLWMRRRQEA